MTCTRVLATSVEQKDLGSAQAIKSAALLHGANAHRSLDPLGDPWSDTPFSVVATRFDEPSGEHAFLKPPHDVVRLNVDDYGWGRRLRIAVKHCAPAGKTGELWGDSHFARHLAEALRRHGHDVVVDNRESAKRSSATLDMVNIVVRGVRPIHPIPGAVNVLWIISRPDRVQPEELVGFDLVYAASESWAARASKRFGREIRPLLQATDVRTFSPRPRDAVDAPSVLFVGNRRAEYRRPVADGMLLAAGEFDAGIYGGGWHRDGVRPPVLRGEFVRNADLPLYYSAADVVMNDHFPTMREYGFLNNRILDALACGTPVLSDDVPGVGSMFGDRVLWYSDASEIPERLREYFAAPWSEEKRAAVAAWVAANHSFDARAAVMLEDIDAARGRSQSARDAS